MGRLKVLPSSLASMIAAGEVVQRPSSVVKELVENSVDAGADRIDVVITDSGRTLIQVIDNGCGMSESDAVLCFERHATSKIESPADLEDILTYGFRGEALPSISAVSEITLKTRRQDAATGVQVCISDFNNVRTSSVSCPVGTNFAVRNLFYNTPARRKFLKSDSIEFKHIIEEFTRIAIPHPEISFSLSHNGRETLVLKAAKSLKFRILDILGSKVVGDIVDVDTHTSVVKVSGFVGSPIAARKTLGNQFFFVNGRFFKSAYLHKAVMKAYEEMIPDGVTPSYFIFLEVDPHTMDVNIHPTKTEIKFENESIIFQILYACVKETLGRNSFGSGMDFETEGAVELPQLGRSFDEYRGGVVSPDAGVDGSYNPFDFHPDASFQPDFSFSEVPGGSPSGAAGPLRHVDRDENYGLLFEQRSLQQSRALVIRGRWILTPSASGVMVVSIRRARERILYEKYLKALSGQSHVSQTSLFPVEVQVGAAQRMLFEDNSETLSKLGFDIMSFGTDSVVVNAVPEGYSCESGKVEQMLRDILLILSEGTSSLQEIMLQGLAEKFAALGASSGSAETDSAEAGRIIDTLFACDNAEVTPGGRRIVSIISSDELEKRF